MRNLWGLLIIALLALALGWHKEPRHTELRAPSRLPQEEKILKSQSVSPSNPPSQTQRNSVPTTRIPASLPEWIQEIERLESCLKTESCEFPKTDPKSYDFAIGQEIKKNVDLITEDVRKNRRLDESLSKLGRELISLPDGHIKEAVLDLFSTQPTDDANFELILEAVIRDFDSELINQALLELQRYKTPYYMQKIDQTFMDVIKTGAPFVAQELSKGILPFIQPHNISYYQQTAQQIPEDSLVYQNLIQAVERYRARYAAFGF